MIIASEPRQIDILCDAQKTGTLTSEAIGHDHTGMIIGASTSASRGLLETDTARIIYINTSTGNNSNPGTSGSPVLTLAYAESLVDGIIKTTVEMMNGGTLTNPTIYKNLQASIGIIPVILCSSSVICYSNLCGFNVNYVDHAGDYFRINCSNNSSIIKNCTFNDGITTSQQRVILTSSISSNGIVLVNCNLSNLHMEYSGSNPFNGVEILNSIIVNGYNELTISLENNFIYNNCLIQSSSIHTFSEYLIYNSYATSVINPIYFINCKIEYISGNGPITLLQCKCDIVMEKVIIKTSTTGKIYYDSYSSIYKLIMKSCLAYNITGNTSTIIQIYGVDGNLEILNCTIFGKISYENDSGTEINISDSIIDGEIYNSGGATKYANFISGCWTNRGTAEANITAGQVINIDPQFVNSAGNDYRLKRVMRGDATDSPCINLSFYAINANSGLPRDFGCYNVDELSTYEFKNRLTFPLPNNANAIKKKYGGDVKVHLTGTKKAVVYWNPDSQTEELTIQYGNLKRELKNMIDILRTYRNTLCKISFLGETAGIDSKLTVSDNVLINSIEIPVDVATIQPGQRFYINGVWYNILYGKNATTGRQYASVTTIVIDRPLETTLVNGQVLTTNLQEYEYYKYIPEPIEVIRIREFSDDVLSGLTLRFIK